jgi:hypothetical protein
MYQHGLKSQPLRSFLINIFPLSPTFLLKHLHVWCGLIDDQLIGPFVLEGRWTADYITCLHFLQGRATAFYGRRSSRGHIKHVAATRRRSASFRSAGRGGPHTWPPRSPYIADTRWNVTAHHGRCCSHTKLSWKHEECNMCCFKMSSPVLSPCRR